MVPSDGGSDCADDKSNDSTDDCVKHRPIGSEPRDHIAAEDAEDDAIRGRERKEAVRHELA
jgi:hypothetical protein